MVDTSQESLFGRLSVWIRGRLTERTSLRGGVRTRNVQEVPDVPQRKNVKPKTPGLKYQQ